MVKLFCDCCGMELQGSYNYPAEIHAPPGRVKLLCGPCYDRLEVLMLQEIRARSGEHAKKEEICESCAYNFDGTDKCSVCSRFHGLMWAPANGWDTSEPVYNRSCENCAFKIKSMNEYPCSLCKKSFVDKYWHVR